MLWFWGWGVSYDRINDPTSDIVRLIFEAEEEKDNQLLFDTLAPFVKLGSWVGLRDDHGEHWRYVFDGTSCQRQEGHIDYE